MFEPKNLIFEQGPIRPPSEAASLLLRFTRNCPWNKCSFCPVYKGSDFSRRSLNDIKGDIDTVAEIVRDLRSFSFELGEGGEISRRVIGALHAAPRANSSYRQVAFWLYRGQGSVFVQDANSLVLPSSTLIEAICYLREKIPGIRRITSYARSSSLAKKSISELTEIRKAGLDRIHIGMESGSDRVLEFVKKGVTAKKQIEAGTKVIFAGMELSEYIMPGLGGKMCSEDHARESARVLNEINPHFIRLRTLRVPPRIPLFKDLQEGRFEKLSDDETVAEIRLFISCIEGISSRLTSDHIMNLLEQIEGTFPDGKDALLAVIDRYLALPPEEKLLFRLGRRGGGLRSLDELENPFTRGKLMTAMNELTAQTDGNIEKLITELGDQYI